MIRCFGILLVLVTLQNCVYGQVVDRAHLPPIRSISFNGTDCAWLTTNIGTMRYSRDGGRTWKDSLLPTSRATSQVVYFLDKELGWAYDSNGDLWRTVDGGGTWVSTAKKVYFWSPFLIQQMQFVDSLHGWIVDPFSVWRTSDGGVSWKREAIQNQTEKTPDPIHNSFFLDARIGWVAGENGTIYRTLDAGATWHSQRVTTRDGVFMAGAFFKSENVGWAAGWPNGGLFLTTDGGTSWQAGRILGKEPKIDSIYFLSENDGWAVGNVDATDAADERGVILRTGDGGRSWRYIESEIKAVNFDRVFFADSQRGWIASYDSVYRTNDGGREWLMVLKIPSAKKKR